MERVWKRGEIQRYKGQLGGYEGGKQGDCGALMARSDL